MQIFVSSLNYCRERKLRIAPIIIFTKLSRIYANADLFGIFYSTLVVFSKNIIYNKSSLRWSWIRLLENFYILIYTDRLRFWNSRVFPSQCWQSVWAMPNVSSRRNAPTLAKEIYCPISNDHNSCNNSNNSIVASKSHHYTCLPPEQ